LTQGGRYAALDVPGRWNTVDKPNNFTLKLNDPSSHGADYLRIYITEQGFDPLTQKLTWDALELVTETGRQAPSQTYTAQVNAGSRTGRHIVYTIWQASHLDQSYYACSDVVFGGGTDPGPAPSTPAPSTPAPSTPAPSDPVPGGCTATVRVAGQWQGGYQAEVQVRAGAAGTRGWAVSFTGTVQQGWNATFAASGSSTVASNTSYNGSLAADGTATFGFIGTGTPPATSVCTAA
jgi:chitin-binding protein